MPLKGRQAPGRRACCTSVWSSTATVGQVHAGGYREAGSPGVGVTAAGAAARGEEAPGTLAAAAGVREEDGLVGTCGAPCGAPAGARAPGVPEAQAKKAVEPYPPATTAAQLLGVLRALRRVPLGAVQLSGRQQEQRQEDAGEHWGMGPEAVGVGVGPAEHCGGEGGAALHGQSWPAQVASMHGKGGGLTARGAEVASPPAGMAEVGEEEEPFLRAGCPSDGTVAAAVRWRQARLGERIGVQGQGTAQVRATPALRPPTPVGRLHLPDRPPLCASQTARRAVLSPALWEQVVGPWDEALSQAPRGAANGQPCPTAVSRHVASRAALAAPALLVARQRQGPFWGQVAVLWAAGPRWCSWEEGHGCGGLPFCAWGAGGSGGGSCGWWSAGCYSTAGRWILR